MAKVVLCPVLTVDHNGLVTQDNIDSLTANTYQRTPGTTVRVACYVPEAYVLTGPSQVTCSANGEWSPNVPRCVRRTSNSGDTTTDDINVPTPTATSVVLSDYSLIIIGVAAFFVLILIIVIIVFLCKHRGNKSTVFEELKQPLTIGNNESKAESVKSLEQKVAYVSPSTVFSSLHTNESIYTGRPKGPPSWHSHPMIQVAADQYKSYRTWSHLSVDTYIRQLDTSRRENPNHSWRDFATLSTHFSHNVSPSIYSSSYV